MRTLGFRSTTLRRTTEIKETNDSQTAHLEYLKNKKNKIYSSAGSLAKKAHQGFFTLITSPVSASTCA